MDQAGIYIHIPFCQRKCTYCGFNTTDFGSTLASSYVTALNCEINYWGARLSKAAQHGERVKVDSIFFGGGTPSILGPEQIGEVVKACRDAFDVAAGSEITIEINPATDVRFKAGGWLRAGINRASVGVQSFIDRELISLSRTHTAAQAADTINGLRIAGFNNLSLDLIAGLPEQRAADWEYNLSRALDFQPEHLSLYLLEVKPGTPLEAQIKRGLRPQPDDDLAAEMYGKTCDATSRAGFEQYEISNFARLTEGPDSTSISMYRSRHNLKYWRDAPFYGVGCGAHSYDGTNRWFNIKRTETYIESITRSGCAVAERHTLSDRDRAIEALFMRLRLIEGVDLNAFKGTYELDVEREYGKDLRRLADAGLIELEDQRLRLTKTGLVLSNEVFQIFV